MSEPSWPNSEDRSDPSTDAIVERPPRTAPPLPNSIIGWLRMWFGVKDEVGRRAYAISGFGLMLFKYVAEAAVIALACGRFYSPLMFLSPAYSHRAQAMEGGPEWLAAVLMVWSLPFLWIAVSMSIRRSADAGQSPWVGLCVLLPVINLFSMPILACWRSSPERAWHHMDLRDRSAGEPSALQAALRALLYGLLMSVVMLVLTVYVAGNYGATLFFASPIVVSAVTAFSFNRPVLRGPWATLGLVIQLMMLEGLGMLLFALEGAICLVMAAPIVLVCGAIGSVIGKVIAELMPGRDDQQIYPLLVLPVLAMLEPQITKYPLREIVTTVEINAPPEVVWNNVVTFPDLPDDREWFFRLGIACPERARIEGTGVGAVRYCIFSTGEFVEPITVWDEPRHLAFDVTRQPHTMQELSPYRHVHAPHLGGILQSRRGEFRLTELPGGRTRLEGRTWYEFQMSPQPYWALWSDSIIHAIHSRVLRHIQRLSEGDAG